MLDDREQELLFEIERRLLIEAPELVRSFGAERHDRPSDHRRSTDMITTAAGLTLCVVLLIGPRPLTAIEIATRRSGGSPRVAITPRPTPTTNEGGPKMPRQPRTRAGRVHDERATPTGTGPHPPGGGIVVGVDGSPGSLAALRWAIREASSRGLAVHAVTAWEFPIESTFGDMAPVSDFHPVVAAEEILVKTLADAGVAADDESVTTTPVEGHPAEVLMQMATGAKLLVVGSRGYGRIFGALLGSVSHYVAAHAACPVVVIKPVANGAGHRFHSGR